jgi:hypothetical protein
MERRKALLVAAIVAVVFVLFGALVAANGLSGSEHDNVGQLTPAREPAGTPLTIIVDPAAATEPTGGVRVDPTADASLTSVDRVVPTSRYDDRNTNDTHDDHTHDDHGDGDHGDDDHHVGDHDKVERDD